MKENEYQCVNCGGIFEKEWSDEEAMVEMEENGFGELPMSEMVVVCDDCYKQILRG